MPSRLERQTEEPDALTPDNAMASPERDLWIAATETEISDHTKSATWEKVPIRSVREKILPGIRTFCVKQCPDGRPLKNKACFCVRGDPEETEEEHKSS